MPRKPRIEMWFGCNKCNYKPNADRVEGNFKIFDCNKKCPKCGTVMTMHFIDNKTGEKA